MCIRDRRTLDKDVGQARHGGLKSRFKLRSLRAFYSCLSSILGRTVGRRTVGRWRFLCGGAISAAVAAPRSSGACPDIRFPLAVSFRAPAVVCRLRDCCCPFPRKLRCFRFVCPALVLVVGGSFRLLWVGSPQK
eukprot:5516462-Prymnesium_polylepis.1